MNPEIESRAVQLRQERVPFVHARVVRAERPTSAKPGDQAVVLPDGSIEGFVGGACADSTVRAQSLSLLDSAEPLLLRISPEGPGDGAPCPRPPHRFVRQPLHVRRDAGDLLNPSYRRPGGRARRVAERAALTRWPRG